MRRAVTALTPDAERNHEGGNLTRGGRGGRARDEVRIARFWVDLERVVHARARGAASRAAQLIQSRWICSPRLSAFGFPAMDAAMGFFLGLLLSSNARARSSARCAASCLAFAERASSSGLAGRARARVFRRAVRQSRRLLLPAVSPCPPARPPCARACSARRPNGPSTSARKSTRARACPNKRACPTNARTRTAAFPSRSSSPW